MVNGIDPVFFKDCRADLHRVWKLFFAIFVFSTDDRVAIVVDELFPDQEVAITVEKGLFCCTAELVLLSLELVRSKDGKDTEDEDDNVVQDLVRDSWSLVIFIRENKRRHLLAETS